MSIPVVSDAAAMAAALVDVAALIEEAGAAGLAVTCSCDRARILVTSCAGSARHRAALVAAIGELAGNQVARWFAVVVIGLDAIAQMFFIPAYPFWSLMIIAIDVVALWGLCAYGSRENLAA